VLCWKFAVLILIASTAAASSASEGRFFALPIDLETDGGAANGDATFLRLMPAYQWRGEQWRLQNLDLILLADAPGGVPGRPGNPEPVPGDQATGLGDWIHASFFTTLNDDGLIWGIGPMFSIPTATDPALGSGKWAIGPALRVTWRQGFWNVGGFGGQRWSIGGDSDRADISQFMMRGTIRRQLSAGWYLVSSPIITANWNAPAGERWLIPVGGGLGRSFNLGKNTWAISLQGYANVVRPEGAPKWSARVSLIAVIPIPG